MSYTYNTPLYSQHGNFSIYRCKPATHTQRCLGLNTTCTLENRLPEAADVRRSQTQHPRLSKHLLSITRYTTTLLFASLSQLTKTRPTHLPPLPAQLNAQTHHATHPLPLPLFIAPIFRAMNGQNHVVNALYPHNLTPSGQHRAMTRFLALQASNSAVQWIKVVDTDVSENGGIIGVAQWYIIDGESGKPEERDLDGPDGMWDSEEKEYAKAVFRRYLRERREIVREAGLPIMCE
jgi:hypothetical protein